MGGRDRWGGGGARVSEFFFHKEFKSKNFFFFFGGGGGLGGGLGVVDGWTIAKAQTILPLQLLQSWGHNNALMYKLCP